MTEPNIPSSNAAVCPSCGKPMPRGATFCTQCGATVTASGQDQPNASRPAGAQGKYRFKTEPPREEHVPESALFVPKREKRKTRGIGGGKVLLIVLCCLIAAYVVVRFVFPPMHDYLAGLFFEGISQPKLAVTHYAKAADSDGTWSEPASKALARLGRRILTRHVELQYLKRWTARSTIEIEMPGRHEPLRFESTITYKAPGEVEERISGEGMTGGRRVGGTGYLHQFGNTRQQLSLRSYEAAVKSQLGFGPDTLFSEAGTKKVVDAFFEHLEPELRSVSDVQGEAAYRIVGKIRKARMQWLTAPFFPWSYLDASETAFDSFAYTIRAKDGFLMRLEYLDKAGVPIVTQTFRDFEAGDE